MRGKMNGLKGYSMTATDGEIGKITDFYFDDETRSGTGRFSHLLG
jgi:hypothetical protein